MATVVADADVVVVADVSKLAADLRKKIEPIAKKIQIVLDVVADTTKFEKQTASAIKRAEKQTATIEVEADLDGINKDVDAAKDRINRSRPAKIKVEVEVDKDSEKASSGFLKRFAKLGSDAGTRFVSFLSESISNGISGLQDVATKISGTLAQGLIGLAAAGAAIAIGFPAAAGAVVALASAVAILAPLVIGLAAPLGALAAIGGTLFISLRDVQDALEGDEEALKRLTPSARGVLNVFSEFKPVLKEIRDAGQEALFTGLSQPLKELANTALPIVKEAVVELATTINGVLLKAIEFFNSAEGNQLLIDFFDDISESAKDIASVIPGAVVAVAKLVGIGARLGRAVLPEILDKLDDLIGKLEQAADNGGLERGFERALVFAKQLYEAIVLIVAITRSVGEAFLKGFGALIPTEDDQSKMDAFIASLEDLKAFLEEPIVQKGIEGIGTALFLLITALGLAALAVGLFISALVSIPEGLTKVIDAVTDFTNRMRQKWDEVGIDLGGMITNVTNLLSGLPGRAASALFGLAGTVQTAFNNAMNAGNQAVRDGLGRVVGTFQTLTTAIIGAFFRLPQILYDAGVTMIKNMINGMLSQLGSLRSAASRLAGGITSFLKLNSPAEEGPLSREEGGSMTESGRTLVDDFARGMLKESKELSRTAASVAGAIADRLGLGPTAAFTPSFGPGSTVGSPDLSRLGAVGSSPVSGSSTSSTSVNNARTTSAVINVNLPSGDPTAAADRIVRRLIEAGGR